MNSPFSESNLNMLKFFPTAKLNWVAAPNKQYPQDIIASPPCFRSFSQFIGEESSRFLNIKNIVLGVSEISVQSESNVRKMTIYFPDSE